MRRGYCRYSPAAASSLAAEANAHLPALLQASPPTPISGINESYQRLDAAFGGVAGGVLEDEGRPPVDVFVDRNPVFVGSLVRVARVQRRGIHERGHRRDGLPADCARSVVHGAEASPGSSNRE